MTVEADPPNPADSASANELSLSGFINPASNLILGGLPSPAPSTPLSHHTSLISGLPHPRAHALRPGSAKEEQVRLFVEARLMHINRRYVKRFASEQDEEDGAGNGTKAMARDNDGALKGYTSMAELCKDFEGLLNILWLSGTPILQIPYFLTAASSFNTWLRSFRGLPSSATSPSATLSALRKLDHSFASLLSGRDMVTGEHLPGFDRSLRRDGLSKTDMVRCKSVVEQTRVLVMEVLGEDPEEDEAEESATETETKTEGEGRDGVEGLSRLGIWMEDDNRLRMDVARVYENTLVKLEERLALG